LHANQPEPQNDSGFFYARKHMTEQQIIDHAQRLIAIRSTSDNPAGLHQAVGYIANILAAHPNITVERLEDQGVPSLLAYYGAKRPSRFDVLMNGHVDVVPAAHETQFTPVIKGDRLYGRGAYDMKTACIAMADVLIQAGHHPERPIGLQIVSDEEVGGYNGVQYHLNQGVAANFTIFGEMTDLNICNEARGLCWVEVAFKGTAAHGGYAWNGDNAIAKASDFANKLLARFPMPAEKQWCTTANIATISTGNETYNIVPSNAVVKVDFRFTSEDANFKDQASVKALIASLSPDAEVIAMPVFEPAVGTPASNPHLHHFMHAYEKVTGEATTLMRRYAGSDGRHFAARGLDSIEFGLGGADHHSEVEYVDMSTLAPFRSTLLQFLQQPVPLHPETLRANTAVVTAA
jgi:succinyl-diaminopimelate desuccinylase